MEGIKVIRSFPKTNEKKQRQTYKEYTHKFGDAWYYQPNRVFRQQIANGNSIGDYYIVEPGFFVYNPRISVSAPCGPFNRYTGNQIGVMSPLYTVYYCCDFPEIYQKYLSHFFLSSFWHSYMHAIANYGARSDRMNVTSEDMDNMPLPFPLFSEQKKIVRIIEMQDKIIALLEKKIEELNKLKKVFLSKMFPQKGCNVPEIRFPGFTAPWEQRKFSEIVETRRGLTYKPSDICENGVRVLRSSNIDADSFVLRDDDVFVKAEAVNIDYTKENDILITAANGSSRLVGKHAIIGQVSPKSIVHGGFMLLGATKEPYFVNASMSSSWYRHFIELFVAGGNGAIGNLNKNDLDNQDILVPSEEEQQQIGAFFRNLDNLITLHQRKLVEEKRKKKALMQLLLTGIVRTI